MSRDMTNAEAIANLKHIYGMVSPNIQRSLDVAFKDLEKQPQGEMSKSTEEINERLIKEYISKVECCDECFASAYCTVNGLRKSRVPQDYCVENIKRYFGGMRGEENGNQN